MVLMVSIFSLSYFSCAASSEIITTTAPSTVLETEPINWTKIILITSGVSLVIAVIISIIQANKKFK